MNLHKEDDRIIRGSRSQMFLKKVVFKNFTIFTGKQLCCSLFLIKLLGFRPATLFKRGSTAHNVKILSTSYFYRTPLVAAFLLSYASHSVRFLER